MMDNVIQLPRPSAIRPSMRRFGHYLHVDWNDHLEVLQLIAEGDRGYLGYVLGAQNVERHRELSKEALKRGFDLILDPKTQQSALPGSYSPAHGRLPWGLDRPHRAADFDDHGSKAIADEIAAFAVRNGFTQVLSATHVLSSLDDPWFEIDRRMSALLRERLPRDILLIYPLSLPIASLREPGVAGQLLASLSGLELDGLWLRIENFGADSSGDKTLVLMGIALELQRLGVAVVADYSAGLVGMGLLAFGAVGGVAHGVMMHELFKVSTWRRPPSQQNSRGGGLAPRVYVPQLDVLLKPASASALLEHSLRAKGHFGCQDPKCCPKGINDTVRHPARHYIKQRSYEIERLSSIPPTLRVSSFVDQVRRTSDAVAGVAALKVADEGLTKLLAKKQRHTAGLRLALGALSEDYKVPDDVVVPSARNER